MSTTTAKQSSPAASTSARTSSAAQPAKSIKFGGLLKSEWIKFASLRSTWWSIGTMILLSLGLSFMMASTLSADFMGELTTAEGSRVLSAQVATFGLSFTSMIAAVLGVLLISGEYSTGMIRSTFTAVPGRLPAVWAKITILCSVLAVVGVIMVGGGFFLTSGIREAKGFGASITDDGILGVLLGGVLYLALIGLMSFGFGAIVRSAAGGIAMSVGVLMVPPILVQILIQAGWSRSIADFLPANAGRAIYSMPAPENLGGNLNGMEYWQSLLVLIGWVLVAIVPAAILVKRRDA